MKHWFQAIMLSTLLLAASGFTACKKKETGGVTVDDVEFWQTYSTEKVLQFQGESCIL